MSSFPTQYSTVRFFHLPTRHFGARSLSSCKLMLWLTTCIGRFEAEHMATLISRNGPLSTPLSAGNKDDVVVLATPSGASGIARWKYNVLEVSTLRAEHHHPIGIEHGDPEVAVCAVLVSLFFPLKELESAYSTTMPSGSPKDVRRSIRMRLFEILPVSRSKSKA